MALRAELFGIMERTEAQIGLVAGKIDVHVSTCASERVHDAEWRASQIRSDEQYRQSMLRVVDEMKTSFGKHCEDDSEFHENVSKAFNRWQAALIATLVTLLLACFGAIGTLVVHGVK